MITLKKASQSDLPFLFQLRNLKSNRIFFRNSSEVSWEEHVGWFSRFSSNPENVIYIFSNGDEFIGQFRIDSDGDVSVSLKDESKGKGFGSEIIKLGSDEYLKQVKRKILKAEIKKENISSIKSFLKAGYLMDTENDEYLQLIYK